MHDIYMKNDKYEVLENAKGDCFIKDLFENKYYFKKQYYLSRKLQFNEIQFIKWNCKDSIVFLIIVFSLAALFLMLIDFNVLFSPYKLNKRMYIITIIYLIINIILHEIGHILILKLFGRKGGRIRFKFNFIYPTFAIDTTDSYILPKYRKIYVYYAGIMINILICFFTYLLLPIYSYCLKPVIWLIIFNLIPIGGINTDGYHIFINSILNIKEYKYKKNIISYLGKILFIIISTIILIISILKTIGLIN